MQSIYEYQRNSTLLVMSSDDYECAWLPYFELLKANWEQRPNNIVLCTETKTFSCEGLNLRVVTGGKEVTWSKRLIDCLKAIDTEYVIFSLEDFFLIDKVDEKIIEKCLNWLDSDKNISVFRLKTSDDAKLVYSEKYAPFRVAQSDIPYRVDTQVAIWRKTDLISLVDVSEDPWHFEGQATERAKKTTKEFLWFYQPDEENNENTVFPYHMRPKYGYGIAWGRWLWKNKELFDKYNIKNVDFKTFGTLSERSVKRRYKYLYRTGKGTAHGFELIVYKIYKLIDRLEKGMIQIRLNGFKKGVRSIKRKI